MTAPRHKVLIGGRAGSSATVKAFSKARKRRYSDRLNEANQAVGDYRTSGMTDAEALQEAFDQASESALRLGQRVKLNMEAQFYDIGSTTVYFKDGVDYDFTGSVVMHRKIDATHYGSIAFEAENISNFSVTGLDLYGPGSGVVAGTIYKSLEYAIQFTGCSKFAFSGIYTNGNSGILLLDCTDGEAVIEVYEISGTGLAVKGGSDHTVAAKGRNVSSFLVFGDISATRVRVLYADKWYDETKINEYDFPYLWDRRRYSSKVALNPISAITWEDNNGGQLVISVTRNPTVGITTIPALAVDNDVFLSRITSAPEEAFNLREFTITNLTGSRAVTVTNGGSGYATAPTVSFSGGGSLSGKVLPTATATVSGGAVTAVTISDHGSEIDGAVTVSFSGGGGSGATATYASTGTITVSCPTNPGTYTSSGWVGDMENTVMCLGLESVGATESCSHWTIDYLKSRNSADAGCSLTGDYMRLLAAEVENGTLVGVTLSGLGSYCGPLKTKDLGHWASAVAKIGGVGGRFTPAAGNFPQNCTFAQIISEGDIAGAFLISSASKYAAYSPGGECGKRWATAESGTPGRLWIFRTYDEVPEYFGTVSPEDDGFVEPDENDEGEYIWNDGITDWTYVDIHEGDILPAAPEQCKILQWSYDGPAADDYQDQVGDLYGNWYPSKYDKFLGPQIPMNGDYLILPDAGTGTITLSSTPQEVVSYIYGARADGNATVSRIAGTSARYAIKVQRTQGTSHTSAIIVAISITGDDLQWFLGKKPAVKMRAVAGADWSDNNDQFSWDFRYATSVLALDADLIPTGSTLLSNGASGEVTTTASFVMFASDTALPTNAQQLILRLSYTPTNTDAQPSAGANDWFSFERLVIAPLDSDFVFRSEERTVTQLRLDAL